MPRTTLSANNRHASRGSMTMETWCSPATQLRASEAAEHRPRQDSGLGQYRSVAMPHECRTSLFGLRAVLCDRLGTRYNAGRIVRDLQVHTSCQPERALAGEGN